MARLMELPACTGACDSNSSYALFISQLSALALAWNSGQRGREGERGKERERGASFAFRRKTRHGRRVAWWSGGPPRLISIT